MVPQEYTTGKKNAAAAVVVVAAGLLVSGILPAWHLIRQRSPEYRQQRAG